MSYIDINNQYDRDPEVEPQDIDNDPDNTTDNTIVCPTCDHEQDQDDCYLGRLGFFEHYRCRFCDITFGQSPLSRDIQEITS